MGKEQDKEENKKYISKYIKEYKDCRLTHFCYDVFFELFGEYPEIFLTNKKIKNVIFLKIIASHKTPDETRFRLVPPIYQEKERTYCHPRGKFTILDIILSKVPRKIAEEESTLFSGVDVETYDYFTTDILEKYRINTKNLYEIYFEDYEQYNEDLTFYFYDFIFSKVVSIQPSIFIPQRYELWELNCSPIEYLKKDERILSEYLKRLNRIRKDTGDGNDAFSQFIIDSYTSIKNKLLTHKSIFECLNCGDLSPYVQFKKYCSSQCRKKAESKRYYQTYKEDLKKYKRKDMKATRALYRKLGVKK